MTFFHRLDSAHVLLSTFRHGLVACSIALLLGAGAPAEAAAQSPATGAAADTPARWTQTFVPQIASLLEHNDPALQARGMQLIIVVAEREDVDLDALQAPLYRILFNYDHPDNLRVLALSALHAVDPSGNRWVLTNNLRDEPSPRVQRHMQRMLAAR